MKPATQSDMSIHIDLPLDAPLTGGAYQDADGEWDSGPTTVLDEVLDRASRIVANNLLRRAGTDAMPYDLFRDLVEPKVDAILAQKVEEALTRKITPTSEYGQPKGEPEALEQWIAGRIDQWLRTGQGDSYSRKPSRLDKAVESFMGREMEKSLDAAMADAKKRALSAFTKVAEEKLADALRASIAEAVGR